MLVHWTSSSFVSLWTSLGPVGGGHGVYPRLRPQAQFALPLPPWESRQGTGGVTTALVKTDWVISILYYGKVTPNTYYSCLL